MTKVEKDEIERLVRLVEVDMKDKSSALFLTKKYINPHFSACLTCGGSIRTMFNILKNWWKEQNVNNYQFIKTIK